MDISKYKIEHNSNFKLSDIETDQTGKFDSKDEAERQLAQNVQRMEELQSKLYAQDKYALLIIFQAMDTAGKDGAIKHVMSGLNPQGTHVHSFKQPSAEELDHDYLWRAVKNLPERGTIGIFNRSYYEDVLVVRVHDLVKTQQIPKEFITDDIWKDRFRQIRDFERYLYENGIITLKFFLHISKDEQKKRLLERIDDRIKNWKFSTADIHEREYWNDYQRCYQETIAETSTKQAPWYVIPSDKKWFARLMVSEVIVKTLELLRLEYPFVSKEQEKILNECRQNLLNEE
ncbi:MAG: polyphosphate kinase 2 family protein [Bacteroidota bacterium]|nr:polyphosphate kinase 2 family protein [Bacteroidota bacterium]